MLPPQIDPSDELRYHFLVKPGTYEEIMERITRSKNAELVRSAGLPFTQKLALSAAVSRTQDDMILQETFADPVIEVIKLFNLGIKQGIFERYALAGGLAVEYYGAPINTVDADFLIVFPESAAGLLDASPFFAFFQRQGAIAIGEYLMYRGSKFQMIPANRPLDNEALQTANSVCEKDVPFFVVSLEYLIALKLNAGRYKDKLHINHLLDSGVSVNELKLSEILERHQLARRWPEFLGARGESR